MKGDVGRIGERVVDTASTVAEAAAVMVSVTALRVAWVSVLVGGSDGFGGKGFGGWSGVVVVVVGLMCVRMRSATVDGVTLSMKVKAGRRRIVVGAVAGGWSSWSWGRGMFDADSINF